MFSYGFHGLCKQFDSTFEKPFWLTLLQAVDSVGDFAYR